MGRLLLIFLLLASPSWAVTKLYLRDTADTPLTGYRALMTTNGGSATSATVDTAASGTNIQWTKTQGGAVLAWISPPLSAAATISGTITINWPGYESSGSANTKMRARVYKYSSSTETENASSPFDMAAELTNGWITNNWTGTPTSTAFAINDRIVVKAYITNVGTMAAGYTVILGYGSASGNGDGWVQFNEDLTFCSEPGCSVGGLPLYQ